MWPNPQETADLVTFSEEILNGKLQFLCSVWHDHEYSSDAVQICVAIFAERIFTVNKAGSESKTTLPNILDTLFTLNFNALKKVREIFKKLF